MKFFFTSVCLFLVFGSGRFVYAQQSLYARLTDPEAICRFDLSDSSALRAACGVGKAGETDPLDNYQILAQDVGSGVITHLWFTYGLNTSDTSRRLKLWVDDSLALNTELRNLGYLNQGLFRPPLDTIVSGGVVCDVQIPFRRNFRITCEVGIFRAIEWRRISDLNLLPPFRAAGALEQMQKEGESTYERGLPNRSSQQSVSYANHVLLTPHSSTDFANLSGPGEVNKFVILPTASSDIRWDSVWIEMFWDHSPRPTVSAPLKDFFGCGSGLTQMHSFYIKSDSARFTCLLPLPFAEHARIALSNRSSAELSLYDSLSYSIKPIDRHTFGYLRTQAHDMNPTLTDEFVQVAHVKGRGRYLGLQLYVPASPYPYFLEGDPVFDVDSNTDNYFRYTGTEDYLDAGWYFKDSIFSLPFAGCTHLYSSFYRFHLLDAVDFVHSFDFRFQHGMANDVDVRYKTVAFFYTLSCGFWLASDTVVLGDTLHIGGTGYGVRSDLQVAVDGHQVSSASIGSDGKLRYDLPTATLTAGDHLLAVDGESQGHPFTILPAPAIQLLRDSLEPEAHWGDTINLIAYGFHPGESVSLTIGDSTAELVDNQGIDSLGILRTGLLVPWIPSGNYPIKGAGSEGTRAGSAASLPVSRDRSYEFEDLLPASFTDGSVINMYMGWWLPRRWSRQAVAFCDYGKENAEYDFSFFNPVTDTFNLTIDHNLGLRYSRYFVYIDGEYSGILDGFAEGAFNDPFPGQFDAGTHFIPRGNHKLRFIGAGKDPKCPETALGLDRFVLKPSTAFHHLYDVPIVKNSPGWSVFPNPLTSDILKIYHAEVLSDSRLLSVSLYDLLGRTIIQHASSMAVEGSTLMLIPPAVPNGPYILRIDTDSGDPSQGTDRLLEIIR